MNKTEAVNMKDFDETGWKLIPYSPPYNAISKETHEKLLLESFEKYGDIWEELARK